MMERKFQKGDRVQFSDIWLSFYRHDKRPPQRQGTIVGFAKHRAYWIKFDNRKSKSCYHEDFLELIPEVKPLIRPFILVDPEPSDPAATAMRGMLEEEEKKAWFGPHFTNKMSIDRSEPFDIIPKYEGNGFMHQIEQQRNVQEYNKLGHATRKDMVEFLEAFKPEIPSKDETAIRLEAEAEMTNRYEQREKTTNPFFEK